MKNDNLDQLIKDSLEQLNPEVPTHLWENIRSNIPAAQPSGPTPGAEQGAAGSAATGTSGLMKLGIAAAVLIGGGVAVWQLSTDSDETSDQIVQQSVVEQQQSVQENAPESSESAHYLSDDQEETTADVEKSEPQDISEEGYVATEQPAAETPSEESIVVETEDVDVSDDADNESITSDESVETTEESADKQAERVTGSTDQSESSSNGNVAAEEDDLANEEVTDSPITPDPSPMIVVEVGILADKVSGETPMSVQFSNLTQAKSFEWDFGNGRKSHDPAPMTTFDKPGDYTVHLTVTDFDGNQLRDQMEIAVYEPSTLFVPNAFSPNGDGANDLFMVEGVNVSNVKFEIFRLDGSKVYEGFGLDARWDGMDPQDPLANKYHVIATAIKTNGDPIQKREILTIFRD